MVSREFKEKYRDTSDMAVGNSTKIPLTEDDIDGASLRGKTPSQLTIPELKRWLSCRKGAKLSGTKRSLVERYDAALDVMFTFRTIHLTERKIKCSFQSSKLYRRWS